MTDEFRQQALALAGACQALEQVQEIARHGRTEPRAFAACLQVLLRPYHGDVAAYYGGVAQLEPGLEALLHNLRRPDDAARTRYLLTLLHLERQLRKHRAMLVHLGDGLERARQQAEYFGPQHDNVISNLAGLYTETVSKLRPRVIVQGERGYLQEPRNADRIRALLLSGVRAASLWREHGGSRLKLLLRRSHLIRISQGLLDRAKRDQSR